MYAVPVLLALTILIALVYLPRIRKPALWTAVIALGLSGLGLGGFWLYSRHHDQQARLESERETSLLVDHAIGKPIHCKLAPWEFDDFIPDNESIEEVTKRAMGEMSAKVPAATVRPANKPKGADDVLTEPHRGTCSREIEDLVHFIKQNSWALNNFITGHQNDPRVEQVQMVLWVNGEESKKTCKDLIREGRDDYELHKAGCK